MPVASEYPSDISSKEAIALDELQRAEQSRRILAIDENWKYYKGIMRQSIKPDGTNIDDNVQFPLVQNIVDKGVSGMLGSDDVGLIEGISFLVSPTDQPRYSRRSNLDIIAHLDGIKRGVNRASAVDEAQAFIDQFWLMNKKNVMLHNIFLMMGITGHIFLKIIPDFYRNGIARIMPLDTRAVTVFWREDDPETPLFYRYEFGAQGQRTRQDFVRLNDTDWDIYQYVEKPNMSGWQSDGFVEWSLPISPIMDWQNLPMPASSGEYYGRDDIGVLLGINDSVNFIASNMQRIQKHHAHPRTVVTGAEVDEIKADIDYLYAIASENAEVYNLEMKSDMASSLNFLQAIERAFYAYGREVDPVALVQKFGDRLTNFAVRVIHGDSLAKRQAKWMNTEVGLSAMHGGLLDMRGFSSDALRVDAIPPDPLPTDQFQQAETLTMDVSNLGLSQATALERRGYVPAMEEARRQFDVKKDNQDGNNNERPDPDAGRSGSEPNDRAE